MTPPAQLTPPRAPARRARFCAWQGDAALEARRKAAAIRSDHRVRAIASLVDDINNARLSLYGSLARKAAELRLPHNWSDRFFQHASHVSKPEAQPTPPMQPAAN